jgi:hypothetical protein
MTNENRIDRRQFAGNLAAGSTAVAAVLASRLAVTADDKPPVDPKDEPKPAEAPERPLRPSEEALLLACLTQRYPNEHFDEAALQGIYRDLRGDLARGRVLSDFPLKNSDEPSFVFGPYRGPK